MGKSRSRHNAKRSLPEPQASKSKIPGMIASPQTEEGGYDSAGPL
jgi:hypothetical protein